jgi:hypothetical protein
LYVGFCIFHCLRLSFFLSFFFFFSLSPSLPLSLISRYCKNALFLRQNPAFMISTPMFRNWPRVVL